MTIQTHSKGLDEILKEVNDSENPSQSLKEILSSPFIGKYINWAVSDAWSTLDVDECKFKQYDYHRSMAGALLLNSRTMSIFEQVLFNSSASNHTKKIQYKALSEMLFKGESDLVKAILKKDIQSLYPNLTHELICGVLNEKL